MSAAGGAGKVLRAVHQVFGMEDADVAVRRQFHSGGAVNLTLLARYRDRGVERRPRPGRYPLVWWAWAIGLGPTLHVTGPGVWDHDAVFAVVEDHGGVAIFFTAHVDSAFAYHPAGFVLHVIIDFIGRRVWELHPRRRRSAVRQP